MHLGVRKVGGCTTTAIAMNLGTHKDPFCSLRLELVEAWLRAYNDTSIPQDAVAKLWAETLPKLADHQTRWNRAKGPLAAVVATLLDLLWVPEAPLHWVDLYGVAWGIDPTST